MRITQIRDDGRVNTLRTLKIEQLVEQMKVETKAQLVSGMREVLPYMLPGDKNDYIEKVPKILPAAVFVRENGVMAMSEYNGINGRVQRSGDASSEQSLRTYGSG